MFCFSISGFSGHANYYQQVIRYCQYYFQAHFKPCLFCYFFPCIGAYCILVSTDKLINVSTALMTKYAIKWLSTDDKISYKMIDHWRVQSFPDGLSMSRWCVIATSCPICRVWQLSLKSRWCRKKIPVCKEAAGLPVWIACILAQRHLRSKIRAYFLRHAKVKL